MYIADIRHLKSEGQTNGSMYPQKLWRGEQRLSTVVERTHVESYSRTSSNALVDIKSDSDA